jgi:hypothetical protein
MMTGLFPYFMRAVPVIFGKITMDYGLALRSASVLFLEDFALNLGITKLWGRLRKENI